ncbi:hypothetical protein AB205_0002200 [Aquarana catesbeiana]|uniref:Uncharacterized protein n=1 Tax=Aquarana catesbeiana TaxID=8400 RepID=A0A2G9S8N4_AQUCT|nr:hypothetical protein AB205_0002200 [Aquarana catesbeiana]
MTFLLTRCKISFYILPQKIGILLCLCAIKFNKVYFLQNRCANTV